MKKEIRPYNLYCMHLGPLVDLLSSLVVSQFFFFSLKSFFVCDSNWQDSMEKGGKYKEVRQEKDLEKKGFWV